MPTRNPATSTASSKARISRLETETKQLRQAVLVIQEQLKSATGRGDPSPRISSIGDLQQDVEFDDKQDDEQDDSDDASSITSEIILQDRPSHLTPLFQNELISTDTQRNVEIQYMQQRRMMDQRLETARKALQPLIPTPEQLELLGSHVFSWLTLLQDLAPVKSLPLSQQDIIASYPSMKEPDVDPLRLGCWLLVLAVTALQLPPQSAASMTLEKDFQTAFPQAVQRAVETHIISHDSLCGTITGLETCLMHLRLSLVKGTIQKTWLALRRTISIAELIGLPRASKLLQQWPTNGAYPIDPHTVTKAKLWEGICSVERLAGTLMHFPIATRHYTVTSSQPLVSNGAVNPAAFWIRLGNIAVQLGDLDDLASIPGCETELYAQVLRLDNEARLLASETPKSWWSQPCMDTITSQDTIKFQFHCIKMRIHLPFVVRTDVQGRYTFSRLAGVDACRSLLAAWCDVRQLLPPGIFFSRPFDAQAFTAAVVLLLDSYNSEASSTYMSGPMNSYRDDTEALLNRVVRIMDERAQDPIGYEYAQQAAIALRALMSLLNGNNSESNEITAKIPSLGTITVRRNLDKPANTANVANSTPGYGQNAVMATSQYPMTYQAPGYSMPGMGMPNNAEPPQFSSTSVDDVFSWVINPNDELLFHENLMFEDIFNVQR